MGAARGPEDGAQPGLAEMVFEEGQRLSMAWSCGSGPSGCTGNDWRLGRMGQRAKRMHPGL